MYNNSIRKNLIIWWFYLILQVKAYRGGTCRYAVWDACVSTDMNKVESFIKEEYEFRLGDTDFVILRMAQFIISLDISCIISLGLF